MVLPDCRVLIVVAAGAVSRPWGLVAFAPRETENRPLEEAVVPQSIGIIIYSSPSFAQSWPAIYSMLVRDTALGRPNSR